MSEVFPVGIPYEEQAALDEPEVFLYTSSGNIVPENKKPLFEEDADQIEQALALGSTMIREFGVRIDLLSYEEEVPYAEYLRIERDTNIDEMHRDKLTGAFGREALNYFEAVNTLHLQPDEEVVLVGFDFDDLKKANKNGHVGGDNLIRTFTDLYRESTRGGDVLIRWGGDEFVGIFKVKSVTAAATMNEILQRLQSDFSQKEIDSLPHFTPGITYRYEFANEYESYEDAVNKIFEYISAVKAERPRVTVDVNDLSEEELLDYLGFMNQIVAETDPNNPDQIEAMRSKLLEMLTYGEHTQR